MKKNLLKRLCLFLVTVLMLTVAYTAVLSVQAAAATVKVASAAQLETALKNSAESICITADFELDRTFYVYGKTTIYADSKHTLPRSKGFGGDIFVVGENSSGKSSLLLGGNAVLTFGKSGAKNENVLIFDGNKANMTAQVKGSFLFVANSSIVNIYKDVSFINAKKTGNSKTLNEAYSLSYPGRIGGAVSVIASGTVNIYGGNFTGNTVNEEASKEDNATEAQLASTMGGAFFNFGNLKIYGGNFSDNQGARGGVIYNYRTLKITQGNFTNNRATTHGGVVCQPASQYARIYLGKTDSKEGSKIIFKGNSAVNNAGALYTRPQSSLTIYGDTVFDSNRAIEGSGGAICSYGVVKLFNTTFSNNSADSKGGAIYLSNADADLTTRKSSMENCSFTANAAENGGALAAYASDATMKEGANVTVTDCKFNANTATENGGAVHSGRKSKVTLTDSHFEENSAAEGGAIYIVGDSKVNVTTSTFLSNKANVNNDSVGGAITVRSSVLNIDASEFKSNAANKNGGSVYIAYEGASKSDADVKITATLFEENTTGKYGGAIYLTQHMDLNKIQLNVSDCDFIANEALKGGAAYLTGGSGSVIENSVFEYNTNENAVSSAADDFNGGAVYVSGSTLNMNNSTLKNNSAKYNGGALGVYSNGTVTVNNIAFEKNTALEGGAVIVRSSKLNIIDSSFNENSSTQNGGAIDISYIGDEKNDSDVKLYSTVFENNISGKYGGAIYLTQHMDLNGTQLEASECKFIANEALKGGATYLTGGSGSYIEYSDFENNTNVNATNDTASDFNGGAVYVSGSTLEMNNASFKGNSAKYNGGAFGFYSGSNVVLNKITATENKAKNEGGVLYNSGSTVKLYNSSLSKNSSEKNGGAVSIHSTGTTSIYKTAFEENHAKNNGGAAYVYNGEPDYPEGISLLQDCSFTKNSADEYGGAVYASEKSELNMFKITATENSAAKGGVLYETTTGTTVTINGITVKGNTATVGGPIIWGNTTKATLKLNKTNYKDSDLTAEPDSAYWGAAIANKLSVDYITDSIPLYKDYTEKEKIKVTKTEKETEKETTTAKKTVVPVTDVFNLGKSSSDADINSSYAKLKKLDNSRNFMSRNTTTFNNINGKNVNVDTFVYVAGNKSNNCTVGEGLLIYQALLYKKAHPKEDVRIDISSFRFSIQAAVNINRNSRYFGYMRNLSGGMEYDQYGFVRISYLLVTAAKMGIKVNVIGQMDGYPTTSSEPNLKKYFAQRLTEPCDPAYVNNGVVGDYLDFNFCYWTSYDDNAATDMMHTKLCAVSHYLDMNGVAHKNAVWTSSSNLDGIKSSGANGNSKMQTATIVSDHEKIYRASSNYLKLIAQYCEQEDVLLFRNLVNERTTKQIQLILAGKESQIPKNEQIVYLGGKNDQVFELYFAPFGGDAAVWDETTNPYCKYMRKMYNSDDYIIFTWNNANYINTFPLGKQMESVYISAFKQNTNPRNKVYVNLESFANNSFDSLVTGKTIGFKSVNKKDYGSIHSKDLQISYSENGQRHYVSILNSLNIHGGSMSYQSNNLLVIKEDNMDKGSVFHTIADLTTKGITENEFTQANESGRTFTKSNKLSIGKLSAVPYTLEATVQVPKTVSGPAGVIVGNYNGKKGKQLNLEVESGGKVKLYYNNGKKKVSCIFSKDIRSDSAVHIAVTIKDNKATLYLNGDSVETKKLKYAYSAVTTNYVIGGDNRSGNTKYFKGTIYSVSLFNDVRTSSEIKRDARGVESGTSGLIYSKELLTTDYTYTDIKVSGRSFSKSKKYSLGKLSATPYTIEATISIPEKLKGRGGVIVGNYSGSSKSKQLNLEVYTEGRIRLFFFNGKKKVSCIFKKDLRTGSPVDIAVTVNGKTATLYVNGKAVESKKLSATYTGITSSYKIGGDNRKGNPEYFKGTIYSVRLFSTVRTKTEIKNDSVYTTGTEKGLIITRHFISSSSAYTSEGLNGRTFTDTTPLSLGSLKSSPKTIEAVIELPKDFYSRGGVIASNYNGSSGKQLSIEIYTNGRVRLYYNNGKKSATALFKKDIRSDRPVHIAVTLSGKKATLYVNGDKAQTISLGISYDGATANFKTGGDNRPGNTQYFKGKIYSVSLFSSKRSDKYIKRDVAAIKQSTSSILYSANLLSTKPVHSSASLTGAEFKSNKYTTLAPLNDTPKTIEALINVSKKTTDKAGVILGNCYGSESKQMNLEVIADGKLKLLFRNGSKEDYCVFSKDIRTTYPVHIAVTVNGKTATLYVNGEKADSKKLSSTYSGITNNFRIGTDCRADGAGYFKGTVYSVSVFSDVRTQKEIQSDMIAVRADEGALLYSGRYLAK